MVVQEMKKRQKHDLKAFERVKKVDPTAAQKIARDRLVAARILTKDGTLSARYR